jgi:phenol hydroxylase P3 protein
VQTYISSHQALQGNCAPEGVDMNAPDFNPGAHIAEYWKLDKRATGDFNGSEDQKNFAAWRDQATKN